MAEKEYIERERIEKFFDGIYDCADLTFEPNDHCCAEDDCSHCKWYEAKNAIQKRILSIPAADVREVVLCRDCDCWNVWDRVRDTCSCGFWSEDRLIYTKEKDFCSWGRKRGVDE